MSKMTLPTVGAAMIPVGTPTFADLLERLAARTDLPATRQRDLASGLRRVAFALGLDPAEVHAHVPWMQTRIAAVNCRVQGLSPKTWSNSLSNCRAAMTLLDRAKPRANRRGVLIPVWRALWEELIAADAQKSIERSVGSFVFFLSRIAVEPCDVANEHAAQFREELVANQLRKDPEETYRRAIAGWNRAVDRWPFWPRRKLSAPSRLRIIRIGADDVPASFYADLDRFLGSLARPNLFDDDEESLRPLRPASIKSYRNNILLFAGALVQGGVAPAEIRSLRDLVPFERVGQGLAWLAEEAGGEPKRTHYMILQSLVSLARRHVRPAEDEMTKLNRLLAKWKKRFPRQRGITEKNLERLRPLREEETLAKLFRLPQVLFDRGVALGPTPAGLILQRDALMLALLRDHPVRRLNLIEIRLDQHIMRTGLNGAYLVCRDLEVKNYRLIEFEMSAELLEMIDRYVAVRSPIMCPKGTPWLFSNRSGDDHLQEGYVSTRVSHIIQRELGLAFNPHLARHTAALAYLSEWPGQYEAVRRLLGHASASSTLNVYASFETDSVGREYSALVQKMINIPLKNPKKKE